MPNDRVLHDVAGAMVDGVAVDWASAEASADDESIRRVVRELRVIAAIAGAHGAAPLCANDQPIETEGQIASGHQANSADVDSGEKALQTWGPLRVLERVSWGAFGAVYRAWDPRLDREVALK